ncbi:Uncharacterised protein [Corynebacterium kutscheri]|uniref:Uncharacterized protein n=1 Tax=Corynebacterium kutscheri TaxID=35755 RepID=A0A0F6QZ17_9CORY|nr:methylase [Corynebacterium kutscheri]AKE40465.1 hypothetical protein UL82_01165 [Corynebacterium kutscheri]VEH05154.1 Uncharacterised protein [Corynebacterium kutscheri]VEH10859.1 Uncharacterised protein [Corynebacterium kutscheri]VEH80664.1 Uncharacterised protein [Corynebacterium kutscheri]
MADHAHNMRTNFASGRGAPVGVITRGTTGFQRLRRVDRWMHFNADFSRLLHHSLNPLALDVGYGASFTTTVEWARWLRKTRSDIRIIGLEIDPQRILPPRDGVSFELGGFELAGYTPDIVRAFNVLRQYDVSQVESAWEMVLSRLRPEGKFVEGTCDELGRRATWIVLDHTGPQTLTLSWDPFDVEKPSDIAERLPKILIHRNIPGEKIHELLSLLDSYWHRMAAFSTFGPRIRWRETHNALVADGVPLHPIRRPIRDNQLTISWAEIAP